MEKKKTTKSKSTGLAGVKVKVNKEPTDRIPYETWINSQLSVARFWGGITINSKMYVYDPECTDNKPDLVCYED